MYVFNMIILKIKMIMIININFNIFIIQKLENLILNLLKLDESFS